MHKSVFIFFQRLFWTCFYTGGLFTMPAVEWENSDFPNMSEHYIRLFMMSKRTCGYAALASDTKVKV